MNGADNKNNELQLSHLNYAEPMRIVILKLFQVIENPEFAGRNTTTLPAEKNHYEILITIQIPFYVPDQLC